MKKKSRIKLLGDLIMDKIIIILVVILVVLILIINIIEKRRNEEYNLSNKSNSQIAQSQENNKEEGNTGEEALYEEARNLFFNEHDYEKTIEKANEVIDKFPKSYKA